ncbi:MAG: hypothetical protein J6386_08525 [Candidatus Synoicihabitans palmerolidicus]|nr:hypothetical protein [Candidatus Synoicihabitans palmerolidicus]
MFTDVLVGDVWLLSGQSNMEWNVDRVNNADAEIAAANQPLIRHLKVEHRLAKEFRRAVDNTGWLTVTPETVGNFSAVGYIFAREVQHATRVPIGLLNISWGGSPIEAWTSAEALDGLPNRKVFDDRYDAFLASYPDRLAKWETDNDAYEAARATAESAGTEALTTFDQSPRRAWKPADPAHGHGRPSAMFNAMITPFLPYGRLRGTLWYQGETNANRHDEYHAWFTAMIIDWRAKFEQGDLPFYWVPLANYQSPGHWDWNDRQWAFLREAQDQTLALPNTA